MQKQTTYAIIRLFIWHHSLAARTHASHAWDRSSILRGATNKKEMVKTISFLFAPNEPNLSSTIVRASSKAKPTSRTEKLRIENVNINILKAGHKQASIVRGALE